MILLLYTLLSLMYSQVLIVCTSLFDDFGTQSVQLMCTRYLMYIPDWFSDMEYYNTVTFQLATVVLYAQKTIQNAEFALLSE